MDDAERDRLIARWCDCSMLLCSDDLSVEERRRLREEMDEIEERLGVAPTLPVEKLWTRVG